MSFYTSQVGKKSSRYCNSNLYGSNLSSVYADGPPPLDDSTQDEDDDEMVFKSRSLEKSPSLHENTDKEGVKTTENPDAKPCPGNSQNASNNSSNDDFGDFSSFADFSSAFGGTKGATTESQSTWFSANGDHTQSAGKSLNDSNQEGKAPTVYSDDDDFACFSGGDESDFENFKGFAEKSEIQVDSKRENVSNGISNNLITQQSDCTAQDAINQNSVLQTDLFSDDDDDNEINDFQSSNPSVSGISNQPTNSHNDNEPMSPLSVDIPPILSDDNDDDDFGDFSSSIFSTSEYNSNATPSTTINQKSTLSQISSECESNNQQDTSSSDSSENLSKPSFHLGHSKDISGNSISDVQQSCLYNKDVYPVDQRSINSTSPADSSNISENNDGFGDVNAHVGSYNNYRSDEIGTSIKAFTHTKIQSSNYQNNTSETLENNENVSQSQNIEKSNKSEKLTSTNGDGVNNDDGDFGDFSTASEPQFYNWNEKNKDNTDKIERNFSKSNPSDDDDFGNFRSTDTDNTTCQRTVSNSQINQDDFGYFAHFSSSDDSESINSISKSLKNAFSSDSNDFKESENTIQSSEQIEPGTHNNDISKSGKEGNGNDFGDFSNVTVPSQCNQDSNFDKFSASQSNSIKTSDIVDNSDDDFGNFNSVQEVKSTTANNQQQDHSDFGNFSTFQSSSGINSGHDEDDDCDDFNQPSSNKPQQDDFCTFAGNDDCGDFSHSASNAPKHEDNDDFGEFGQPASDDDFGDFGQPSKPVNSFRNFRKSSSTNFKSNNDDDFGDFGKPGDNNGDDFGEFGKSSLTKPVHESDNDFGDFSEGSSSTNTGFADFKTSSVRDYSNTKTSESFGRFTSGNHSSQSSDQLSFQSQSSVTMVTNKDSQYTATSTKISSLFQPHKTPSITVINNLIKQGFVSVPSNVQGNVISVTLEHELNSGKPSIWGGIKGAERDGSLRFEWIGSDHKLKMLEALSMLPVRIQTSASFKSSGPVQTPLFASGLGLLEPTKGVITTFHHVVEEINPSQDPFGAPPEVGITDLGFGGKGNGSKKDALPGHLDIKDSSDTISVSSSLDLDFLAPASSTGDLTKPEGKALFEDDLLGLGMQLSSSNESPTVFNSSKDQKKILKLNTIAVSLPSDDKNLSDSARKIVNDFEDLSFMLSKVLMFPLKSSE